MELRAIASSLVFGFLVGISTALDTRHTMQKRQIFREQLLPYFGGKIPEDAFRSDRLALNRLNSLGVSVPDGVLLELRNVESHHKSHRNDPDIEKSIIKLVQTPDGRYTPPEGRYPFNNLVKSTYIIRPPLMNSMHNGVPPVRPIKSTLRLPAKPFFQNDESLYSSSQQADAQFDLLNTYNTDFPGNRVWSGFGALLFNDNLNRILRQTRQDTIPDRINLISPEHAYPALTTIPQTSFQCITETTKKPGKNDMMPDPNTSCQVFHLCHSNGSKESFLCPQGLRFDPGKNQCSPWKDVQCPPSV